MFTKSGIQSMMASQPKARQTDCLIRGHFRTHVFEFPKKELVADGHLSPAAIVEMPGKRATVLSDLQGYFRRVTPFRHFAICCSLRAQIEEALTKGQRSSNTDRIPLFVVVEQEVPCEVLLEDGTCFAVDQKTVVGGRAGEEALLAWKLDNAPWPSAAEKDSVFVDTVLAAVKIVLDEVEVIRELVQASCFYDDNGRAVYPVEAFASMNLQVISPLTETGLDEQVGQLRTVLADVESKRREDKARIDNLVGALRLEKIDSDDYRRSWYLSLFEATKAVLSGTAKHEFLRRHKDYRNKIGHPKPGTKMDMDEFSRLQRDALSELRRLFLSSHP